MLALELAMGLLLGFGLFQRDELGLGEDQTFLGALASRALSRLFMVSRSWRCHTQRTPAGETVSPRFLSSLATRTWPKAGCSTATATMASSISSWGIHKRIKLQSNLNNADITSSLGLPSVTFRRAVARQTHARIRLQI